MILTCIRHDRHARPFRSTESLTATRIDRCWCTTAATWWQASPPVGGGPENPKPGRESTTTPKASEEAVSCADGPASSGSSFQCSRNKLGQQQRQRIWPAPGACTTCTAISAHLDTHLSELVETGL